MTPVATAVFAMGMGGGTEGGSMIAQFIPLILIFVIFWFLVIRPQQRKAKAHKQLVQTLRKGDEVFTDGGIMGTIQKVADDYVTLEIAPKVPIRIVRSRIAEVINRSGRSDD
jgi:preprotein translocase subunit YajC